MKLSINRAEVLRTMYRTKIKALSSASSKKLRERRLTSRVRLSERPADLTDHGPSEGELDKIMASEAKSIRLCLMQLCDTIDASGLNLEQVFDAFRDIHRKTDE